MDWLTPTAVTSTATQTSDPAADGRSPHEWRSIQEKVLGGAAESAARHSSHHLLSESVGQLRHLDRAALHGLWYCQIATVQPLRLLQQYTTPRASCWRYLSGQTTTPTSECSAWWRARRSATSSGLTAGAPSNPLDDSPLPNCPTRDITLAERGMQVLASPPQWHLSDAWSPIVCTRTHLSVIFSIQETRSWDGFNLELLGYVCYGCKFGLAILMVSDRFFKMKRSGGTKRDVQPLSLEPFL